MEPAVANDDQFLTSPFTRCHLSACEPNTATHQLINWINYCLFPPSSRSHTRSPPLCCCMVVSDVHRQLHAKSRKCTSNESSEPGDDVWLRGWGDNFSHDFSSDLGVFYVRHVHSGAESTNGHFLWPPIKH